MSKKKKKRKLRLNYKGILRVLIFILLIVLIVLYLLNLKIKNIYIIGNDIVSDNTIIEKANIKDYPEIFKLNTYNMKKDIESIPLIHNVKIKRDILGKISIYVEEDKVLFYYKPGDYMVTSSIKFIEDNNTYLGIPILINETPKTILNKLVKSFNKVDSNILKMINTIEYYPYYDSEGKIIDETRFRLIMNDANTVMIDTVNIKKLNNYLDIYVSLNLNEVKGVLYLDTITDDNILFESYDSIQEVKTEEVEEETNTEG